MSWSQVRSQSIPLALCAERNERKIEGRASHRHVAVSRQASQAIAQFQEGRERRRRSVARRTLCTTSGDACIDIRTPQRPRGDGRSAT